MAKKILSSTTTGCAIYRDESGVLRIGLSRGTLAQNEYFYEEEFEKREDIKTGQYCGSIGNGNGGKDGTGSPMGIPLGMSETFAKKTPTDILFTKSDPFVDADLYDPGLIIATIAGYYYVNTESSVPYGLYLGNSAGHALILKSVGVVVKVSAGSTDKINGKSSRWSFEDGTRVHLHRTQQTPHYRIFPYFQSYGDVYCDLPAQTQWKSHATNILIPWYGFSWRQSRSFRDVTGMGYYGYNANPSGCITQPNWLKWGREFYLRCEELKDYHYYEIAGIAESYFPNNSIRMARVNFEVECNISTVSSSNFMIMCKYYTNLIRSCEEEVHVVVQDNDDVLGVAEAYAQNMADNQFMSHIDPYTGKDMVARITDAGVTDSTYIGEVLCTVTYDEVGGNEGEVADKAINTRWKESFEHFSVMIDSAFYKCAFGKAYDSVDKKWYCCGLFRTTEGDEALVDTDDIVFPDAVKDVRYHYDIMAQGIAGNEGHTVRSVYSAFSTIPDDNLSVSALCYEVFSSTPYPYSGIVIAVPDNHKRTLYAPKVDGPGDYGTIGSVVANYEQHESSGGWIANRGQSATAYRRMYEGNSAFGPYGYTNFYVEYHSTRPIVLRLWDIISVVNRDSTSAFISTNFMLSDQPTRIYGPSSQKIRTSPMLAEGESEPAPLSNTVNRGGNTELYIGGTFINNASDEPSGLHINPFQTISVTSTFHSNSGYTCVTYTRTRTLENLWTYWNTNAPASLPDPPGTNSYGASEKYWWIRQSLWCAVLNPSGTVIANFEVKGTVPKRSDKEVDYEFKPFRETYYQPDTVTKTITMQVDGVIEAGSVEIWAFNIEGKQIIIKQQEDSEDEYSFYVYYGDETKFDSAEVSLTTGIITVKFNVVPGLLSAIDFYAEVSDFSSVYAPIHHYSEHVCYSYIEWYDTVPEKKDFINYFETEPYSYRPNIKTISYDGLMPINPNATITEDGSYLVIGFTNAWAKVKNLNGRVEAGGNGNLNDPNWWPLYEEASPPVINYDRETLTQVIVLDMNKIVLGEPTLVQKPFLFSQLEGQLTETLVLN